MAVPRATIELTTRGRVLAWLAGASMLGAWLSGDANVRIAAALLAAPLIVDYVQKPRDLGRLEAAVQPRRTVVGAPFREEVRIGNRGRAIVRDVLVQEPRTRGRPTFVDAIAPGERGGAVLSCQSQARSHLLERVFEFASEWPLGLFRCRATAVAATDFVTEPRRSPVEAQILQAIADRETSSRTRSQLPGDEFHALREHQPDEDARGVHALRSAAFGSLVRTVVRGRLPRTIGIVLDLRRPPGRPLQLGQRRFEWSLGACATILDAMRAQHATVRLWLVASRTWTGTIDDQRVLRDVMTLLAEVGPSSHRPLETSVLQAIDGLEHCFWIPAGGYHARDERDHLRTEVHLVDGGVA